MHSYSDQEYYRCKTRARTLSFRDIQETHRWTQVELLKKIELCTPIVIRSTIDVKPGPVPSVFKTFRKLTDGPWSKKSDMIPGY